MRRKVAVFSKKGAFFMVSRVRSENALLAAFMDDAQLLRQLVVHIAPNSLEFYQVLQAE